VSLLGIDIGTSGLKAVVFDATTGGPMAGAQVSYPTLSDRPGQAELDPEAVWSALRSAVGEVAQQPTVRHDPIEAIGWAASGDEIVLVDGQGRALDTAILAADTRGSEQLADLEQTIDASRLSLRTGVPSYPAHPLIRLLWYRDNEPGFLAGTSRAVGWA
jgi:gluconokinase